MPEKEEKKGDAAVRKIRHALNRYMLVVDDDEETVTVIDSTKTNRYQQVNFRLNEREAKLVGTVAETEHTTLPALAKRLVIEYANEMMREEKNDNVQSHAREEDQDESTGGHAEPSE